MASTRFGDALSLVIGAWTTRRTARRVVTTIILLMALAGAGLLAYPAATDFYSKGQQRHLATEFASPEFKTQFANGNVQPGQVLTRIEIDAIHVDALIVSGTDLDALRAGAGHYTESAMPCEPGNVAIAGHRTTFGKPFERLDELKVGDKIKLYTPEKKCTYKAVILDSERFKPRPNKRAAAWITTPDNISVIGPLPGSMLTLTSCHPKRSAKQRLVLRAEMVSSQ